MIRKMKIIVPLAIVAVGFVSMIFFLGMRTDVPRKTFKAHPRIVSTMIAHLEQKSATISGLGRVVSSQPVNLYSEVTGTIESGNIAFQPAQSFKKGDLLLKIDDRQIRLDIKSAKAELLSALAIALAEIKSDYPENYQTWRDYFDACNFESKLKPLPEADDQRIRLLLSRLGIYKSFFAIMDLEIMLEKHYLYAPFSGSIVSADLRVGSTARVGSYLGQIINLDNLEVELPVNSNEIGWIRDGAEVKLISEELNSEWKGRIVRIGGAIDQQTQTIPVYIKINNKNSTPLYEGLYLNSEVPGIDIEDALVIPRHALYNDSFVYLIKDGKFEIREVSIARKENDSLILSGGVMDGDTVVIDLLQGITTGMLAESR